MPGFRIEVTEEARLDLLSYFAHEQKIITGEVRTQLEYQPLVETRNRKQLRGNPVASWELRIGKFRVFYEVHEDPRTITIVAVGHKEHNKLFVRGKEVKL